jgi:hypothetical protein
MPIATHTRPATFIPILTATVTDTNPVIASAVESIRLQRDHAVAGPGVLLEAAERRVRGENFSPLKITTRQIERALIGATRPRRERRELVRIYVPFASQHQAEAIEIEVDNRRGEERERLTHDQSADNRDAQRPPQL